jgi:hypothetical protein
MAFGDDARGVEMRIFIGLTMMLCLAGAVAQAQGPGVPHAGMERMIVVTPMIGAGTLADPRRPLGMPPEGLPAGVESLSYVLSDDGKFAIVQVVSRKRLSLTTLAAAVAALPQGRDVATFAPHLHSRDVVERALKLLKKDFRMEEFLGGGR